MTKRKSNAPVFLLYAGIVHAIGLALLLPTLITLPGPGGESAPRPKAPAVDVVVLPAPQPLTDIGPEQTSALPPAPPAKEGNAIGVPAPSVAEPKHAQEPQAEPALHQADRRDAEPSPATQPMAPDRAVKDGAEAADEPKRAVANLGVETAPQREQAPQQTEPSAPEADRQGAKAPEALPAKVNAKAQGTGPARAASRAPKKSSAQRKRAKSVPRNTASRPAKSQTKFAPLNGMLSGLFTPPTNKRK